MYKITTEIIKRRPLMQIRISDGSCSCLAVHRPSNGRYYSSSKNQEQNEESSSSFKKFFWGVTGLTLLTGGAVVYAHQNPETRKWVTSQAPWTDDIFITLENSENWTREKYEYVTSFLGLQPKPLKQLDSIIPKKETVIQPSSLLSEGSQSKPSQDLPKVEEVENVVEPKKATVCDPLPVNVQENQERLIEYARLASDNYAKAAEAYSRFHVAISRVAESSIDSFDPKVFAALRDARTDRDSSVTVAERAAAKAEQIASDLNKSLPDDAKKQVDRHLKDIQWSKGKYVREREKSTLADKYWDKVDTARKAYVNELQTLFPGIDISAKRLNLTSTDVDLLLLHTVKQVAYLQRELANAQIVQQRAIENAIASRSDQEILNVKVQDALRKERMQLESEYQKKVLEIEKRASQTTRDELKKQIELHEEILKDKLAEKEKQVLASSTREISEKIEQERLEYREQLAIMTAKLRGVEDALKARAAVEKTSKRAQALWAAGASLHAATARDSNVVNVASEINSIVDLSGDDELVKTVMEALPKAISQDGVCTESLLKEQYLKMEKAAMRLALVKESGSPLHVYFLSWLMSKLIFKETVDIPRSELEDGVTDFSKLDTFEILQRARYYMERGNLAQALRYANLLSGAPGRVSEDWRREAAKHLEAKLAANTLMAHATRSAI